MTFKYFRPVNAAGYALVLLSSLAAANTPEQIFVQVSPSVVVVDIFDAKGKSIGLGSGAVIGAGQVITNCHVAQKGKSLQVRQSGKTFKATLQYADPDRDLCQLSVPDLQAPPVTLGTANKLRVGQRVYAIGAPQGLELTLSEGLVSSLRPYEGSQYIQTSAAISPGSSGGGLFDDQGRLVGITTFYLAEGQSLNFALPVDWINELPKRAQAAPVVAKKGGLDWLNRAVALEEKKDWQGMLKLAQQWIKSEPGSAVAWYGLGVSYANHKQYDQAIQAYREALRIQPEYAKAWNNLGAAYNDLKQYDQAIQALREALRIEPGLVEAWNNLGNAYNDFKQYDQAIQAYREALRIQPEYAEAWSNLGIAYYRQGRRDRVREIYQTLRKLDPARADEYFNLLILP
jgi:tetratricopeptide (TPR) repeat protein